MEFEKLLNKLIEKGWRPFDVKGISEYFFESVPVGLYRLCWKKPDYDYNVYSKRDLVSKESGLRQFCCENKLVKEDCSSIELYIISEGYGIITDSYYQFWLMMCSLKDESELEKFLIDNIKI